MFKQLAQDYERIERAILYLENNLEHQPSLGEIAAQVKNPVLLHGVSSKEKALMDWGLTRPKPTLTRHPRFTEPLPRAGHSGFFT